MNVNCGSGRGVGQTPDRRAGVQYHVVYYIQHYSISKYACVSMYHTVYTLCRAVTCTCLKSYLYAKYGG